MTEEELVAGCKAGKLIAQKQLYEQYSRKMFGVCLRYSPSVEDAEDVLQDAFIKVLKKIDTFDDKGSLEGWIRRIVVNTALDMLRKEKKFQGKIDVEEHSYQLPVQADALDQLKHQDLLAIIQEMPAGYKTVFNMFAIEGYSHKEIADMMNISENTSKSQYSRARSFLLKKLEALNVHR